MNVPCTTIYQQRQRLDVGRKQLLHAAIFEDQTHDRVARGERLNVLLVGSELLGFGHSRFGVDAQLGKQHLAQLTRRIDVERRLIGQLADLPFELGQLFLQFYLVFGQRLSVNSHTGPLHIGQHVDHRLLAFGIEILQPFVAHFRPQRALQLQRNVGVLSGIFGHTINRYHIHRELLCSLAYECLNGYWCVV